MTRRRRDPAADWAGQRRQHVEQVGAHRFVAGWGPRRSATVLPAPLRYWQYEAPGPGALALAAVLAAGWVAYFAWGGGWTDARSEVPFALGLAAVVLVLNTRRTTVSDHGLSTHTAGTRPDPAEVVTHRQVLDVRIGRPQDPRAAQRRGRWWPGRTRVTVRYAGDDGEERELTLWARDPEAFGEALG